MTRFASEPRSTRRRVIPRTPDEPETEAQPGCLSRLVLYASLVLAGFVLGVGVSHLPPALAVISDARSTPPIASVGATTVPNRIASATGAPSNSGADATRTAIAIPDVAIVAGHYGRGQTGNAPTILDPGSVCSDGLREVDINLSVAQKTLALLAQAGVRNTTLFEEFDSRLKDPAQGKTPDFRARAFLSIHSDACVNGPNYPLATGWKVAHAEPSDVPEADDHLVRCIKQGYGVAVRPFGLTYNENTVTVDMTAYHGFRAIVPTTPAAIIELGFLGRDRDILTRRQDELARGLADGLVAFLQGDGCAP